MICIATSNGVFICEHEREWRVVRRALDRQHVTSVSGREGVILAGTADGLFRSTDRGRTWHGASAGLNERHVRWLSHHPEMPDLVFAGTEPAGIYVSWDGGTSWHGRGEVARLRDEHHWSLPYSPAAGCIRGFAFIGERGYAAAEVGGVLRTDDRGVKWRLADGSDGNPNLDGPPAPFVYPDVHSVELGDSPELVFAATGGGFYRSADGGATWKCLYECYCRAVWVDLSEAQHLILGPADYVDSNGRIEESRDGGETWRAASAELKVPWRRHMVERFAQAGSDLFAVLSNGELYVTPHDSLQWRRILPDIKDVHAVAALAG
ncbi:MAG TPA: hypothetical protein VGJ22_07075 [Anaerolineales bacterium]